MNFLLKVEIFLFFRLTPSVQNDVYIQPFIVINLFSMGHRRQVQIDGDLLCLHQKPKLHVVYETWCKFLFVNCWLQYISI